MSKDNQLNSLKIIGKDCAYTFKGLYKTADFWQLLYHILLLVPLMGSFYLLYGENSRSVEKTFGVMGLFFTLLMYIFHKNFEKVNEFRALANDYKSTYDEILIAYNGKNMSKISKLTAKVSSLRKKTTRLNIPWIARKWARWRIKEEMDLEWLELN